MSDTDRPVPILPTRSRTPPPLRLAAAVVASRPVVEPGEVPDHAYAADLSRMASPGRRRAERPARFFVPADRFTASALAAPFRNEASLPDRLEAVRPIDWMLAFRCDPAPSETGQTRALTAQDHAILEVLISSQRETDPAMRGRFASCPVAALRNVVGVTMSDASLATSLRRLSSVECVLPGVHAARSRMTWRRRKAVADAVDEPDDDRRQALARYAIDIKRKAFTRETDVEAIYKVQELGMRRRFGPPAPAPAVRLACLSPERAIDWWDGSRARLRRFVPVVRWLVEDGVVHYEIATWLRVWTDASRSGPGHARTPYAVIDLRQIACFGSPYSAPLYRQLVARTFDTATRTARIGDVEVRIPMAELPELVGYRVQRMGLAAQVKRKILDRTDADFSEMTGRIAISPSRVEGSDVVWTVHVPVDVSRMRSATKWRMPDGRLERIVVGKHRNDLKPLWIRERFSLRVRPTTYLKVMNRLRLDREGILLHARAWQLAVDEALRHEDPRYSDLTGRGHDRRHRGTRLLADIAERGPETAFYLWSDEENADPDLTRSEVLDVLELDGTERAATMDREFRWEHGRLRKSGEPYRTERLDGRLPVDPEELRRRERDREGDAILFELARRDLQRDRSELLSHLADARAGIVREIEPDAEATSPSPSQPRTRFPVRIGVNDADVGYVPDPEVRLDDIEGTLHFVWHGTRQDEPVRIAKVIEELEMLGYDRPTIADLAENAPALFEGETGTFEIVPPRERIVR